MNTIKEVHTDSLITKFAWNSAKDIRQFESFACSKCESAVSVCCYCIYNNTINTTSTYANDIHHHHHHHLRLNNRKATIMDNPKISHIYELDQKVLWHEIALYKNAAS